MPIAYNYRPLAILYQTKEKKCHYWSRILPTCSRTHLLRTCSGFNLPSNIRKGFLTRRSPFCSLNILPEFVSCLAGVVVGYDEVSEFEDPHCNHESDELLPAKVVVRDAVTCGRAFMTSRSWAGAISAGCSWHLRRVCLLHVGAVLQEYRVGGRSGFGSRAVSSTHSLAVSQVDRLGMVAIGSNGVLFGLVVRLYRACHVSMQWS